MKSLIPVLLLAFLIIQPAVGQTSMSTDRPDFTESPLTVGTGTIQVEAGATMQTVRGGSILTSGEGLVRYGLKPRFELRLGLPSLVSGEDIDSGLTDISVGIKWNLTSLDNGAELGLVAGASLPSGGDDFTTDEVNPSVLFVASQSISDRVSLAGQVAGSFMTVGDDWKANWLATVVMGTSITDNLGGFLELKAEAPPVGDNRLTIHTGLVYPVSDNFQLDFHLGTGLNDAAGDEFVGVGLAVRR